MKSINCFLRIIILSGFILLLFVGCGKNGISNSPVSETKNESGEKEICYIDYDSSLNGVLLFSTGDKLSFTDLKEGGKGYVCNIPGCFHDGKNKECPAVKYAGAFYPFEYGEKIYFLFKTQGAEFLNDTGTSYKLIEMNKDGSDYKEIYSFGENEAPCIGGKSALRVNDKMYFSMLYLKREIDENGYDNIRESRALIYEFDILNMKVSQIYKAEKGYSEAIPDLWNGGDKLIVSLEYQKNSLEDSGYTNEEWMNIIMNSANMSAEEWKTVYEKIGLTYAVSIINKKDYSAETTAPSWKIMGVWDDKLIVQDDDELNKTHDLKFEAYDFRTKTYTDVPSPFEDYRVEPFSGGVILKNNEKNEYSVLKDGNHEPGPVRTKEKEFAIFKESKDYFYLAWFGQDEGPFDNYELVEKKTILE